jgi:hypothetical protein
MAVQTIMSLYYKNNYRIMSVDSGYGSTQIELIHKELVASGKDPADVLNIVDATRMETVVIRYTSPLSGSRRTEEISIRMKNKLVGILAKELEDRLVILEEENGMNDGLVMELRNFRRKSANLINSGFQYTDQTHSVSALQLCLHGYMACTGKVVRDADATARSMKSETIYRVLDRSKTERKAVFIHTSLGRSSHSRTEGLGIGRSSRHLL